MRGRATGGSSPTTAAGALADGLRGQVLAGQLAPGTPLREEALALEHAVSRHTVRAALALLVAQRLATSTPYAGVRVTALDDDEVRSLQDLRRAVESEAVRLLVARHGDRWPAAVDAVLAERVTALERAVTRAAGSPTGSAGGQAVLAEHAALHHALVAAAGSPRLTETSAGLDAEIRLFTAHLHLHEAPGGLVAEHRAYLADVRRRGPAAVHDHVAASERALLSGR